MPTFDQGRSNFKVLLHDFSGAQLGGRTAGPTGGSGVMEPPCQPVSIASRSCPIRTAAGRGSWCLISAVDTHRQGQAQARLVWPNGGCSWRLRC
jgi:hypothetical protein